MPFQNRHEWLLCHFTFITIGRNGFNCQGKNKTRRMTWISFYFRRKMRMQCTTSKHIIIIRIANGCKTRTFCAFQRVKKFSRKEISKTCFNNELDDQIIARYRCFCRVRRKRRTTTTMVLQILFLLVPSSRGNIFARHVVGGI